MACVYEKHSQCFTSTHHLTRIDNTEKLAITTLRKARQKWKTWNHFFSHYKSVTSRLSFPQISSQPTDSCVLLAAFLNILASFYICNLQRDDILGTEFHEANMCINFVNRITVTVLDFWRAELEVARAVGAQSPESI